MLGVNKAILLVNLEHVEVFSDLKFLRLIK